MTFVSPPRNGVGILIASPPVHLSERLVLAGRGVSSQRFRARIVGSAVDFPEIDKYVKLRD